MVTHGGVVMIDSETRLQNILVELGKIVPSILDERQRRLICGCISKGYGGDKVNCHVDLNLYKKSVKISDKQFQLIDMEKDDTFGDYIYVIKGLKKCK